MAKLGFIGLISCWVLLVGILQPVGHTAPAAERQTIEALIRHVGSLKDAQFIRNGSSYSAAAAATFLRRKWQANVSSVNSARDFVEKVASFSGTSGEPYRIRFKDGREIPSKDYLLAELKLLENAGTSG
jgi:hypothetical protein